MLTASFIQNYSLFSHNNYNFSKSKTIVKPPTTLYALPKQILQSYFQNNHYKRIGNPYKVVGGLTNLPYP